MREFHVDSFPTDRIFVNLDSSAHEKLFAALRERFPFRALNSRHFDCRLKWPTFKQWRRNKSAMPLWFVLRAGSLAGWHVTEIEQHVIALKGPSTSTVLHEPPLPLLESGAVAKLLAHLAGDGHVGGAFGTNLPKGTSHSEYRNFEPTLIDTFATDMKAFGTFEASISYTHGHVIVPNAITYILSHLYGESFDTFGARVPKAIKRGDRALAAAYLRAYADDEAHVYESSIEFYSANEKLLQDVRELMNNRFPEINTSSMMVNRTGPNPKFSFKVYATSLRDYFKHIGFDSEPKRFELRLNLLRQALPRSYTRKKHILDVLRYHELTAKQLAQAFLIGHSSMLSHLNQLKIDRKVRVVGKLGNTQVWVAC